MPENYSTASQTIYGFGNDAQKVDLGQGKVGVAYESFLASMEKVEAAVGQKILQDNQNQIRVAKLVAGYNFTNVGTSVSGVQTATALNQIFEVLNQLVVQGKE